MYFSVYNDTETGWYAWVLRDGPDEAFVKGGVAPTIPDCLEKITAARTEIARYAAGDPYPIPPSTAHSTPDPDPTNTQPPHADAIPLNQNVPATHTADSTSLYLSTSRFG